MTFGFIAKGDTGALLASSESANYEFSQRITSGNIYGNVIEYSFSPVDYPVFFVEVPVDGKAGILDFTNNYVRIIGDAAYPVNVYKRVSGVSGFGIAAYDSTGLLAFKASSGILNVLAVGAMDVGGTFTGNGSMVSFPALASKTLSSYSDSWENFDTYVFDTYDWVYTCHTEWQYVQVQNCGFDPVLGYSCTYTYEFQPVEVCGWTQVVTMHTVFVQAQVRTTNWSVQRAVARRTGANNYAQDWVTHKSGYYKEVVDWRYIDVQSSLLPKPDGYNPPYIPFVPGSPYVGADGVYTRDNVFPYSNGQTKSISATILTG